MLEIKSWKFIPFFFIKLSFFSVFLRFLLSSPLWWPGAEQVPWETLAPGHGQDAPWPHGAMRAMSSRRHGAYCAGGHRKRGCGKGIHRADGERVNLPAIDEKKIEK